MIACMVGGCAPGPTMRRTAGQCSGKGDARRCRLVMAWSEGPERNEGRGKGSETVGRAFKKGARGDIVSDYARLICTRDCRVEMVLDSLRVDMIDGLPEYARWCDSLRGLWMWQIVVRVNGLWCDRDCNIGFVHYIHTGRLLWLSDATPHSRPCER